MFSPVEKIMTMTSGMRWRLEGQRRRPEAVCFGSRGLPTIQQAERRRGDILEETFGAGNVLSLVFGHGAVRMGVRNEWLELDVWKEPKTKRKNGGTRTRRWESAYNHQYVINKYSDEINFFCEFRWIVALIRPEILLQERQHTGFDIGRRPKEWG